MAPKSDTETVLQHTPGAYEVAEGKLTGIHPSKFPSEELNASEDFLDPKHPLYGTVDEYGRPLPGWLEQITVRCPFDLAARATCAEYA